MIVTWQLIIRPRVQMIDYEWWYGVTLRGVVILTHRCMFIY